jgi:hypothetical protein
VVPLTVLFAIRQSDPDGRPWEPTVAERAGFRAWVVRTYGLPAWEQYMSDGWDRRDTA